MCLLKVIEKPDSFGNLENDMVRCNELQELTSEFNIDDNLQGFLYNPQKSFTRYVTSQWEPVIIHAHGT